MVDDHALVRAGLRRVLETANGFVVEDEGGTAHDAVRLARLHKPDVVLLDIALPDRNGIEAIPEVLQAAPHARVVVVSMLEDKNYVRAAFAAGASGYVLKDAPVDALLTAVHDTATGGQYVDPVLGARLAIDEREPAVELDVLSEREREVMRLIALGHTNQEISRILGVSDRTSETHRANLMRKLKITSRAEVVHHALIRGLLD